MKIDPKGRIPPRIEMTSGSINHLLFGIGLGTALTRQGVDVDPDKFLPKIVPIKLSGSITKSKMQTIAT